MRLTTSKKIVYYLREENKQDELLGLLQEAYIKSVNRNKKGYGLTLDAYSGELSILENNVIQKNKIFLIKIQNYNNLFDIYNVCLKNKYCFIYDEYKDSLGIFKEELIEFEKMDSIQKEFYDYFLNMPYKEFNSLLNQFGKNGERYLMNYYKEHQKIKYFRIKENLKQRELANLMGVCTQQINDWENHRKYPNSTHLIKLADILKVSVKDLYDKE